MVTSRASGHAAKLGEPAIGVGADGSPPVRCGCRSFGHAAESSRIVLASARKSRSPSIGYATTPPIRLAGTCGLICAKAIAPGYGRHSLGSTILFTEESNRKSQ